MIRIEALMDMHPHQRHDHLDGLTDQELFDFIRRHDRDTFCDQIKESVALIATRRNLEKVPCVMMPPVIPKAPKPARDSSDALKDFYK